MPNFAVTEGYSQFATVATVDANNNPATYSTSGLESLKSDTVDLPGYTLYRGIMCSVGGAVVLNDWDGKQATVTLAAGVVYPIRPRRIWSTGTTATGIIGFRSSFIND